MKGECYINSITVKNMRILKKKVKSLISIFLIPFTAVFMNSKILYFVNRSNPLQINKLRKTYFTTHNRPKKYISNFPIECIDDKTIGIIIQGPLVLIDSFTYESVKLYKEMFPYSTIVVSTWEGEEEKTLNRIKSLGIHVIENKLPENSGILNMNYQIMNTFPAIKYLQGKVKYVAKTRADTRIYSSKCFSTLLSLLETFPSNYENQEKRIIGIDVNTSMFLPFSFSDVFQFGLLSDLYKYWDVDTVTSKVEYNEFFKDKKKIIDTFEKPNPEIYLNTNYLQKIKYDITNSYESYYKSLKDLYIVINKEMINLFWAKYSSDEYYWNNFYDYNNKKKVRFEDWIVIYANSYSSIDKRFLNGKL